MRIAVIGVGGTGSAATRHLAGMGHEVVGYERFRIGHDRGSSHGESRIIRYTYPDSLYTQMMADAYPLWSDLEQQAGEELFVRCGGLFFGALDDARVARTEEALAAAGLPYDRLPGVRATERFPALKLTDGEVALYQSESGFLRSSRCVAANARLAVEQGAELREEHVVTEVLQRGDDVIVRTYGGGEDRFDRAIVTAGAWMNRTLDGLNLPLTVTRQQIIYLAIAANEAAFEPVTMPVWIDATENYYGFPADGRVPGIKLASHTMGDTVDPDHVDRLVDRSYMEEIVSYAERRMPDLSDRITFSVVCLYTNTPNEDFIIDRVPGSPDILLVSGCSGHGFKFTVLLGKIAALLATGQEYGRPLDRFSLATHLGNAGSSS